MKDQKTDGDGAGLHDWLSYQARTAAAVQRETDVVDWDEGIEVQEEWLPRELCEQRLRDEVERVPAANGASDSEITPVVELQNVPLEYFGAPESKDRKAAEAQFTVTALEDAELDASGIEVIESEFAEADFSLDLAPSDLMQDLPGQAVAVTIDPQARETTLADLINPMKAQQSLADVAAVVIDPQIAAVREITTWAEISEPKAAAPVPIEASDIATSIGCSEPALQT
jgi:hypothetical protein